MIGNEYWSILEIEPTSDRKTLKRAYAKKLKQHNPETDPEGFKRLREAYEYAQDYYFEHEENPLTKAQENSSTERNEPPSSIRNSDSELQPQTELATANVQDQAEIYARKIWVLVKAGESAKALAEVKTILSSDEALSITFLDQFEFDLLGYFFDPEILNNWPEAFATEINDIFEVNKRAKKEDRFFHLSHLFKDQEKASKQKRKETLSASRNKFMSDTSSWVTNIYSALDNNDENLALSIAEQAFETLEETPVFKPMFCDKLTENILSLLQKEQWPTKFIARIIEECELRPKDRAESPHKKLIDHIEKREKAHYALERLKNTEHYADTFNLLRSLTNIDKVKISKPERNQLSKIINIIDNDFSSLWLYELKNVPKEVRQKLALSKSSLIPSWGIYLLVATVLFVTFYLLKIK